MKNKIQLLLPALLLLVSMQSRAIVITAEDGCSFHAVQSAGLMVVATFYEDADGDGYGNPNSTVDAPLQPAGYVSTAGDCDDTNADIHPGAPEICDGIDNNCNGILIEGPCPDNMGEVSSECGSNSLSGEGFFTYGSVTNSLNPIHRMNGTAGQPLVGTAFGPELNAGFGFWSRFLLAPAAPAVQGTQGELPDRVQVTWEPDPLSPAATEGFNIYRDGSLLSSVGPDVRSFLDFNVIAGQFYTYAVAGVSQVGEGYKGEALGFLSPNGIVTGKVETFTGNPVVGAVVTLTPTTGRAVVFDGSSSSFTEYDTIYPVETFTFSSWVKLGDGNNGASIVDFGSHLEKNWWLHTMPGGTKGVTFGIGRGAGDVTEVSYEFPAGEEDDWHYVAASFSGAALLLYVDGELIETAVATIVADSSRLYFGQSPGGGGHYTGKLDEVRFYNEQLPQTDIQMLMNRTAGPGTPGLVSYWKFDEGVGPKAFNTSVNKITAYHCGTAWTSDKPPVVNAGITDINGFYSITGINYGTGTTFTAIPEKNFYFNQSLEFNAVNESYADLTDFDIPDTAAITTTVKAFDFSGKQVLLSKADAGGNSLFQLCLNSGNIELDINGQVEAFGALEMGYHHLAMNMYQSGGSLLVELYKNGTLVDTRTFTGVATNWTGLPWKIGAKADGLSGHTDYFTGLIDEVVFFNNALTLPEIQEYANVGTDVTHIDIASVFGLNEGEGDIIEDMGGPAFTGDGTVHGATWSVVTLINETMPHEFSPGSRLITLDPSNTSTDQVNFTDQSTIPVSGFVRFAETSCFQQGAEILVNGQSFVPPVKTDADGKFIVDLAPGSTVKIAPVFSDHTYNINFWELRNLNRPVAGILFQNTVKRKVDVELGGGDCRKPIIPAGASAHVKLQTLNGCYEETKILAEGEEKFTFENVPPDSVSVAVIFHSVPVIHDHFNFQGGTLVDLSLKNDTTEFIYYAPPELEMSALDTNACGDPMLHQIGKYKTKIKVFEDYFGDLCYLESADLTINNEIADDDEFTTQMTEGELEYEFVAGKPNILPPFKKTLQVAVDVNGFQDTELLDAVVLGDSDTDQTFATTSPEIPLFIVRDPPGDASYAYVESGTTKCTTTSFEVLDEAGKGLAERVSVGPNFEVEAGVIVTIAKEVDIVAEQEGEFLWTKTTTTSGSTEMCITTNEIISTSDGDAVVGAQGGDVFMGGAMNMVYGKTVRVVWDTMNCAFKRDTGLIVVPNGFATTYIYSEYQILNEVIPNLDDIDDSLSIANWLNIIKLNNDLKAQAVSDKNISFDAGVIYEFFTSSETTKESSFTTTHSTDKEVLAQFGAFAGDIGFQIGPKWTWHTENTSESSTATNSTVTTGYVLSDDDPGDFFSVDVLLDPRYRTPVFKTKAGESSCPHEPNTQPRDGVSIQAPNGTTEVNVPMNDRASFQLLLGNISQSEDQRVYVLETKQESNPDGAIIRFNGFQTFEVEIGAGETVEVNMTVERGPNAFSYEDLEVALFAECEDERAAILGIDPDDLFSQSLLFDVYFLEPCSPVDISSPQNGWVITPNAPTGDILNINVVDYDPDDTDMELIRVQYRRVQGDGAWINITEILREDLGPVFTNVEWNTQGLQDGYYEFRAVTQCFGAQSINPGISHVIQGTIERTAPEVFGIPEPADGVLSANDEISITFTEDIRCDLLIQADLFNNNNVGLYDTRTGNLVDAVVTCSGDKITIVPNVPNQFIENRILRVQVNDIDDLAGNRFVETDWEFFVDRNPLRWQAFNLDAFKFEDESSTFYREIANTGGSAQAYTLTDIPIWVEVFPTEGFLTPGETQLITFIFDEEMVRGDFADTIFMDGALGDEPLPIYFRNLCRSPEWEFDPSAFTYSMNFSLELNIQGEVSEDRQDIVAAFIDGDLRGKSYVEYVPALDRYEAFLTVYSDEFISGQIEFQIWDAAECALYGDILESFPFVADDLIGTPDAPQVLHTNGLLLREIPLHAGWNWISFNLEFPDSTLDSALVSLQNPENDLIKSQTDFANYHVPSGSWIGSLAELNNVSMYQYLADVRDTIKMLGTPIDLSAVEIPVVSGWNWIGYLPQDAMTVNEALASLTPLNGDVIKSQTAFAQYVAGFGWLGNLDFMQAPKGYLLKLANGGTLTYPNNVGGGAPVESRDAEQENRSPWTVNPANFEHSMILIGMMEENGVNVTREGQVLGAFVDGEVRGVAPAMYVEALNEWLFFLTTYANQSGEPVTFRLYEESSDEAFDLQESMLFSIDGQAGSIEAPMPFVLSTVSSATALDESTNDLLVQPNPFDDYTIIRYQSAVSGEALVTMSDAMGRVIKEAVLDASAGWNELVWNTAELVPGMYVVKVEIAGKTMVRKVLAN